MPLSAGTRLGVFEILAPLGKGGMGEVYRAKDTKLDREVAIKVLPEAVAADADRLARFRREAQLLAALSHPNIAAIHGLDEADNRPFLVLELVEGEDLSVRLRRGAIPLEDSMEIAVQIAAALGEAHDHGIVHRDLKPSNIKIAPDGSVKVLDFGLAKAFLGEAESESSHELSESPTVSHQLTEAGVILGTAAYMAPEQARGKPVDKRADIWAFGVVLFEMLTGTQLFGDETVSDTLASILKGEPDWTLLPPETPRRLSDLLHRCLRKDVRRRVHDIGDARIEIEEVQAESSLPSHDEAAPANRRRPARWAVAGLLAAALASGSLTWLVMRSRTRAPAKPVIRAAIPLEAGTRLAISLGEHSLALSPDGTRVVFTAEEKGSWELRLRSLDAVSDQLLQGTAGGQTPFFSPDGEWIGFYADGKLKKVAVDGSSLVTLCDATSMRGGAWGTDGYIYFPKTQLSGLWRVAEGGGVPEEITRPDSEKDELSHRFPHLLPGGRAVLYTVETAGSFDNARIDVLSLQTLEQRVLVTGGFYPKYSDTGHLVYARTDALLSAPFDAETLEVLGPPVRLPDSVLAFPNSGIAVFDLSRDGTLVHLPRSAGVNGYLVRVDQDGDVERLYDEPLAFYGLDLSPDGRRVALCLGNEEIWTLDLERAALSRLTTDPATDQNPVWAPDGRSVFFTSTRAGAMNLYRVPADGSGSPERLTESVHDQLTGAISPDGSTMLFRENSPETGWDAWILDLAAGQPARPFLNAEYDEIPERVSPDGRWLAYTSSESGRWEVYLRTLPEPTGKWQISTRGGITARWSPDGRKIYYEEGRQLMFVSLTRGDESLAISAPTPVPNIDLSRIDAISGLSGVSPDGRSFIMVQRAEPLTSIALVLNWSQMLVAHR